VLTTPNKTEYAEITRGNIMMDDMRYEPTNDDRERMIEVIMECEECSYSEAYDLYYAECGE
jgi:hypothetical protein